MEQKEKKRRKKKSNRGAYYDYNLLAIVILLICFGLIMLYSTSAYEAQMKFHGDDETLSGIEKEQKKMVRKNESFCFLTC